MKKSFTNITKMLMLAGLATTSANAFDVTLVGSAQQAQTWSPSSKSNTKYHTADTTNIGIQIGHYKNSNNEGFGFGWHIGGSIPSDFDFSKGGTIELGISPGYSITRELAIKIELGLGDKDGMTSGIDGGFMGGGYYEKSEKYISLIYGLSVEYVFADSYVIGGAVKVWNYSAGDGLSDGTLVPELSIGYRF